jgi:hypothetical protein
VHHAMWVTFTETRCHIPESLCTTTTCSPHPRGMRVQQDSPRGFRGRSMQDPGFELRRITLPRTWVNKGKKREIREP